jgi:hypothetical protein
MEKLNETLNRVDVTQTAPKESGHGDHRNEEGLLICGKCGTPKEMRLTCEALGRSSIVPIPCECAKAEEREREERKKAEERRVKAEQMRKECFPASGFYRDCTFEADDGKTPNTSSLCERYAATFDPKDPYGLLLLGDVGRVGHCSPNLPFRVVRQLCREIIDAPVDKFFCFFAFHG